MHYEKPEEQLEPDAANKMVYHKGGFKSLLSLSRAPKGPPTVVIVQEVQQLTLG
jgi:hypothetical protein